jgi:hypothetical protein
MQRAPGSLIPTIAQLKCLNVNVLNDKHPCALIPEARWKGPKGFAVAPGRCDVQMARNGPGTSRNNVLTGVDPGGRRLRCVLKRVMGDGIIQIRPLAVVSLCSCILVCIILLYS